jgi:cytochrome c peroxidase
MRSSRLVPVISLLALLALTAACGGGQESGQRPEPETDDQASASDADTLPPAVLIGVKLDEFGREVPGTATMRVTSPDLADAALTDQEAAWRGFDQGAVVGGADELDADSSSAQWASLDDDEDWSRYQPSARTSGNTTYQYNVAQRYSRGDQALYVYRRPGLVIPNLPKPKPDADGPKVDDTALLASMQRAGVKPLLDSEFRKDSREKIELGRRLFFDPLLSAKGDVACVSCHVPQQGTTTTLSLGPTGEVIGGRKRGPMTINDVLGRNAPALFNLGHSSWRTMFWDARIKSGASPTDISSPAGAMLPAGLDGVLAAQALFPLVNSAEMGCGSASRKRLVAASSDPRPEWDRVIKRVLRKTDYQRMFDVAFPGVGLGKHTIAHLGNAIAAFEADEWRADNSAFDRYVRGDKKALTNKQKVGAELFYGKASCGGCHSGALQTNQVGIAIAIPQFGPGAGDGHGGVEDFGVGRVTGNDADRYKFRVPSLRNVTVSGPYGHNGAYANLRDFVRHYTNPVQRHDAWQPQQVRLPRGLAINDALGAWQDPAAKAETKSGNQFPGVSMTDAEIDAIVDFLSALTGS